ncbi:MAG: regulatory protein RecX, partial [Woeseia sp.]
MPEKSPLNDEIRELQAAADQERFASPQEARKKAMDYLARREYGQAELKKKLAGAGFTREATERAVDQLTADNLQDDLRFAESFMQSRISKGKGPLRVQLELSQRGIDSGIINTVLDEADLDWLVLAKTVRRKKFGDGLPADFAEKARQMRFLQYRGFEPEQVQAAVGR